MGSCFPSNEERKLLTIITAALLQHKRVVTWELAQGLAATLGLLILLQGKHVFICNLSKPGPISQVMKLQGAVMTHPCKLLRASPQAAEVR